MELQVKDFQVDLGVDLIVRPITNMQVVVVVAQAVLDVMQAITDISTKHQTVDQD
jgi:hypothetical protein